MDSPQRLEIHTEIVTISGARREIQVAHNPFPAPPCSSLK